jgi:hypothetical protein
MGMLCTHSSKMPSPSPNNPKKNFKKTKKGKKGGQPLV